MFFPGTLTQISILHPLSSVASGEDIMGRDRFFSSTVGEETEKRLSSVFHRAVFFKALEMNGVVVSSKMALLPPLNPSNGPASSRFSAGRPRRPIMMAY